MFFRRGPSPEGAPEPENGGAAPVDDGAVDTVGTVLRTLAHFEADDRASLEGWANHALTQTPPPGRTDRLPPGRRDWAGLRTFVVRLLETRHAQSTKNLGDLRDALQAITRSLFRAITDDRTSDSMVRGELMRLKNVAETRPPEEIKACALATVEILSGVLQERETRHAARATELAERARVLESRLERAEQAQLVDPLTNIANRRGFDVELDRALEAHLVFGERCVLMMLDIDHFKKLNDAHGHVVGDTVLKAVARSLAMSFPRRGDCVARYGGEEFAVILRNSDLDDGLRLARRCLATIRGLELWSGDQSVFVTASAGVASLVEGNNASAWIGRADQALYDAKRSGRDRAVSAGVPPQGAAQGKNDESQGVPKGPSPQGFSSL